MELATGILQLAEIAKQNGGSLPPELARQLSLYRNTQPADGKLIPNQRREQLKNEIIRKALWT